jgi:hypothetical protein
VEPATKFSPVTVSVKGAAPAAIEVALSDVMVGPLTVKTLAEEEAVLEFFTVTFCGPTEASCAVGTSAVSAVGLVYAVASAVVPHITVELPMKFVPVTESVKERSPANSEAGLNEVMVGPTMVTENAADVAPPGLCTVRLSLPVEASRLAGTVAVMDVMLPAVTTKAVEPA